MRAPDLGSLTVAMQEMTTSVDRAGRGIRRFSRDIQRVFSDSPGDRHVERIIKEILSGKPGRDPALRLECAAMMREVIDRG